jgi:hypothetical protein
MTTLLRELLDERSAAPDAAAHHARLALVHRRITRARRQRVASASAAVAAVAIAVAMVTAGGGVNRTAPTPIADTPHPSVSPTMAMIEGIPEYYAGGRVLTAASGELPAGTATLTFVPDALDLMLVTKCSQPDIYLDLAMPDGAGSGGRGLLCGSTLPLTKETLWVWPGLRVGEPYTLSASQVSPPQFVKGPDGEMTVLTPTPTGRPGTISIGIARVVPFKEYRFPPRPAVLPPLAGAPGTFTTVTSAPGDPLAPQTFEADAHGTLNFFAQMQTPGTLRVKFNGKVFMTCVKWDYEPTRTRPTQADADSGCTEERVLGDNNPRVTHVTITVIPEHVTGDWAVQIDQ